MNASVSPRSGHPSEPAGSRAPAVPLAVTCCLLIPPPDEDQRRGMKRRTMTAARSSAAVTEPTDAAGQEPPPLMGHIARARVDPDGRLVVLIVDLAAVCGNLQDDRVTRVRPEPLYEALWESRRVLQMEGASNCPQSCFNFFI